MEFKPEYIRCTWNPELEGKEVCYSDSIDELWQEVVNSKDRRTRCEKGRSEKISIQMRHPKFPVRLLRPILRPKTCPRAGQDYSGSAGQYWVDWLNPSWDDSKSYRIKPEEETPVTHRELARWLAQGNGQIYHHDESGFRTEVKTFYVYHQEEDNCDCTINKYLQCKIRKWGDTEWVKPTREYMGLDE